MVNRTRFTWHQFLPGLCTVEGRLGANDNYGYIYSVDLTDYSTLNITYVQNNNIIVKFKIAGTTVYTGDTSTGTKTISINVSGYTGVQAIESEIGNITGYTIYLPRSIC